MTVEEPDHRPPFLLISGASSGIGRVMAIDLSRNYRLILGGRNAERLCQTISRCAFPERHLAWNFDLALTDGIVDAFSDFLSRHAASVAAFVHCAAVLNILPLKSMSADAIADMFRINVFSAIEITKVLTKKKINHQTLKSIVFVSSIVSKFGAKGFSAYAASKGALDALMKSLAVELAPSIRVNSVLPGALATPMTTSIFADADLVSKLERTYPLGLGGPSDVISAVKFLLSDEARWITGQQLTVDGGRTTNISA